MKKRLQGALAGFIAGIMVAGGVFAAGTVRIVVDGREIHPKDANGNSVSPILQNGTTYLPVRAVADALGKPVYWDGPNYTVYIGDMDGLLDYPSVTLEDLDSIENVYYYASPDLLTDNYGNTYSYAHCLGKGGGTFRTLLNMKYSRFKCTLYVSKGFSSDTTARLLIKADGKVIYTSPDITKETRPIDVDVDITGCNDFEIVVDADGRREYIPLMGDNGFYQ